MINVVSKFTLIMESMKFLKIEVLKSEKSIETLNPRIRMFVFIFFLFFFL